jgi:hypothetical protein
LRRGGGGVGGGGGPAAAPLAQVAKTYPLWLRFA